MLFGKYLDDADEDDDDEIEDDVDDDLVQNTFRPLQVSRAVHFDWTDGKIGMPHSSDFSSFHRNFFLPLLLHHSLSCA